MGIPFNFCTHFKSRPERERETANIDWLDRIGSEEATANRIEIESQQVESILIYLVGQVNCRLFEVCRVGFDI